MKSANKINKKTSAAVTIVLILSLLFLWSIYGFYADEFIYKLKCVNGIADSYKEDIYVQEAFVNINAKIKNLAEEKDNDNCAFCVPEAFADDERALKYFSLISEKYSFLRDTIYGIIYDNDNIYYIFEEAEYIFVYSESKEIDLQAVNNANYFKYKLDKNMYLFIKYQYYD